MAIFVLRLSLNRQLVRPVGKVRSLLEKNLSAEERGKILSLLPGEITTLFKAFHESSELLERIFSTTHFQIALLDWDFEFYPDQQGIL